MPAEQIVVALVGSGVLVGAWIFATPSGRAWLRKLRALGLRFRLQRAQRRWERSSRILAALEGRQRRAESARDRLRCAEAESAAARALPDPLKLSAELVLARGEDGELQALQKALELDDLPSDRQQAERTLLAAVLHAGKGAFSSRDVSYAEVARGAAGKAGVSDLSGSAPDLERRLITHAFEEFRSRLSAQDRRQLNEQMCAQAARHRKSFAGLGAAGGAMVAAQASGFGVYLMASSLLGAASGAVGVTLPFAVYTGLSSTIATVIGPIGWLALAAWGLSKISGPDYRKAIPGVMLIGAIRARLVDERDARIRAATERVDQLAAELLEVEGENGVPSSREIDRARAAAERAHSRVMALARVAGVQRDGGSHPVMVGPPSAAGVRSDRVAK